MDTNEPRPPNADLAPARSRARRSTANAAANAIENLSRRGFLKGLLSSGALVLGVHLVRDAARAAQRAAARRSRAEGATLHPDIFVGIESDGTVYIVAHRSEMGTGIRTSLPLVVADELDADW